MSYYSFNTVPVHHGTVNSLFNFNMGLKLRTSIYTENWKQMIA